jgi:hypothetical protein
MSTPNITVHFDAAMLPPPQSFYERELGPLSRPDRRGWARPKRGCPFHNSKSKRSFYIQSQTGGFVCFQCGAKGGDVLDFVKLRDHLSFKQAAQMLGAWRGEMTWAEAERIKSSREERERKRLEEEAQKEAQRRARLDVRTDILTYTRVMREVSKQLAREIENEALWECLEAAWQFREQADAEYLKLAGLEVL